MKISDILETPAPSLLSESISAVPLVDDDFERLKHLMNKPIPAIMASICLQGLIQDDELDQMFESIAQQDPSKDVRPLVAEWVKRVMPDQLPRFGVNEITPQIQSGSRSPIHGA